jgi:hypothetical protein
MAGMAECQMNEAGLLPAIWHDLPPIHIEKTKRRAPKIGTRRCVIRR